MATNLGAPLTSANQSASRGASLMAASAEVVGPLQVEPSSESINSEVSDGDYESTEFRISSNSSTGSQDKNQTRYEEQIQPDKSCPLDEVMVTSSNSKSQDQETGACQAVKQQQQQQQVFMQPSRKRSQTSARSCGSSSSGRGTNQPLDRSSSRSMLDLEVPLCASQPFQVYWKDLTFGYQLSKFGKQSKRQKYVLNNISGSFQSNQLVAVIGPSGCGKTTLLQFLAGNKRSPQVQVNGLSKLKVAFIGQHDCLLTDLTARETLVYASRLQNKQPNFNHQAHILPITRELGLVECIDRKVNKLSGGQLKRVIIAQELLYPTNLLILDEITSGLDATTSYAIVRLLKQLTSDTSYAMSIVMSIHQPSARLFSVFDRVYLMGEGSCIYEGSCDSSKVNSHLRRFGLECPKYHNIADYLIEIASSDVGSSEDKGALIRRELIEYHRAQAAGVEQVDMLGVSKETSSSSTTPGLEGIATAAALSITRKQDFLPKHEPGESLEESMEMLPSMDPGTILKGDDQSSGCDGSRGEQKNLFDAIGKARRERERPFFKHVQLHLCRSMLRIGRSRILVGLQLASYILLAIQLATFYKSDVGTWGGCPRLPMSFIGFVLDPDSETARDNPTDEMRRIQENVNFLLIAVMTSTFAALEITVLTFPLEAKTVKREWGNGWYRVSSYFLGRTLADLPFSFLFISIFSFIVYSMTNQIGLYTWRFAYFSVIILLNALIAQSVGFIFGAAFMHDLSTAVFLSPLMIFPSLLFSGFFVRNSQVPHIYQICSKFSHFKYTFEALLVTLYGFDRCRCNQMALDQYHESLHNQTSTMRDIGKSMLGSSGCSGTPTSQVATANPSENSIEDTTIALGELMGASSSVNQLARLPQNSIKPFEDALVERLFAQMASNSTSELSTNSSTTSGGSTAMDQVMSSFTSKITDMFNSRSNFGRPVPTKCENFKSFLMAEFELSNDDLINGMMALLFIVIIMRIFSNIVLNFSVARRSPR